MKTAFTLALAVGVASASNLRTVAGGDIKFLRANPGATGMSSGQGDKLPLCAQYCQGKPTTCEMAFEFMEPQGCGGSCPQAMKEQLLMEMGCSPDTAATGGANDYGMENQQFGATGQVQATQPLEGGEGDDVWTDCHGCTSTGGFCGTPSGLASGEQGGQTAKVYCGEQNCPRGAVNSGDAGPAHGHGDKFPPCAQTCQGKPTSCDMALEWIGYEGCGEHCDQTLKDQLLSEMGCTEATEKDATGVAANNAAIDASDSTTALLTFGRKSRQWCWFCGLPSLQPTTGDVWQG